MAAEVPDVPLLEPPHAARVMTTTRAVGANLGEGLPGTSEPPLGERARPGRMDGLTTPHPARNLLHCLATASRRPAQTLGR